MRIAFVNQPWNRCPPRGIGSIALWTWEIARRLAEAERTEVTVYAKRADDEVVEETIGGVRFRRFDVDRTGAFARFVERGYGFTRARLPLFASHLHHPGYVMRAALDARAWGADVVHVHNFSQDVPVFRALHPRAAVVLHMHCEWLSQLDRAVIGRRIAGTALVAGCSDYVANAVRGRFGPSYGGRVRAIYNGVDPGSARSGNARSSTSSPRLLFVGRLTPEKGVHVLVDAFDRVLEAFPDATLDLVGPEAVTPRAYLVDRAGEHELACLRPFYAGSYRKSLGERLTPRARERTRFHGEVDHDAVGAYYREADLLVNPSLSESFGMALIEAMAHDLPVVATRIGGMPEIVVDGETGMLVEPNDAGALADAIVTLLRSAATRASMGGAGRERAERLFAWDVIARDVLEEYAGIHQRRT